MELVRRTIIDVKGTLLRMTPGDSVEIKASDAAEGKVRAIAFRLGRAGKMKFHATVAGTNGTTRVTRVS